MKELKVLRINTDILEEISQDRNIDIYVYSKNRNTSGGIGYCKWDKEIEYLYGAFSDDEGYSNKALLKGECVILITDNNVLISYDFDKIKDYISYEEITIYNDLVNIVVWELQK